MNKKTLYIILALVILGVVGLALYFGSGSTLTGSLRNLDRAVRDTTTDTRLIEKDTSMVKIRSSKDSPIEKTTTTTTTTTTSTDGSYTTLDSTSGTDATYTTLDSTSGTDATFSPEATAVELDSTYTATPVATSTDTGAF